MNLVGCRDTDDLPWGLPAHGRAPEHPLLVGCRCSSEPGGYRTPSCLPHPRHIAQTWLLQEHNSEGPEPWEPSWGAGRTGRGSKKDSSRPSVKLSVKPSGRITAWGGGGLPRPEVAAWALSQPGLKPSHQGGQMGRAVFFLWPGQTASWLGPSSALPPSCLQPFCCPAPGLLVC